MADNDDDNPNGHDYYGEHQRRIKLQVWNRLQNRNNSDPFALSVTEFQRLFRMPQNFVLELADIIRPHLRVKLGTTSISVEIMTLCAILFYAQGSYQRPLGRTVDLNLSQASVSESLTAVTDAFNHPEVLLRFLKFPRTRAERNVIIERNTRWGFPGVLGYVDGSLVGLASPHGPAKHIYRSRKGFYAINTLVVCDADLNILYFNAQFPGSAHDSWVYRRTPIRNAMREAYRDGPCWLLGDSAYPHEPWLMKPILEAAPDSPEWRYTRLHCRGRSSVERCIGVLKGRWRCLRWERSLHYQPDKAGKIAQACVVLHNFLRARNVADPEPFAEDDNDDENVDDHEVEELEDELAEANRNRNHLVQVAQQRHQQQHQ